MTIEAVLLAEALDPVDRRCIANQSGLRLEFLAGTDIRQACTVASVIAAEIGDCAQFSFNGVEISVPAGGVESGVNQYHEAISDHSGLRRPGRRS